MKKVILLLSLITLGARATMIQWFCDPRSLNLTEEGALMDEAFRFELGVFHSGFVPTAENIEEWSAHWTAAQRVVYHASNQWFSSVFHVKDNQAPFTLGRNAYIWGFRGDPVEGEWILFRHSSWRWPNATPNPVPRKWNTRDASSVIVGSVASGTELMRSARVTNKVPPVTGWRQWLADKNESPDSASVLEYATGNPYAALGMVRNGDGTFELVVPRRADRPANFKVEVSESLSDPDWKPAGPLARLVRETPTSLVFEKGSLGDVDPNQLFFRFKVSVED